MLDPQKPTVTKEEFDRFQQQLIELRTEKYEKESALLKAQTRIEELEASIRNNSEKKTSELPFSSKNFFNKIQSIGSNSEALERENSELRDKVLQLEAQFQLQISTLRTEYQRLEEENQRLANIPSHDIVASEPRETQTPCLSLHDVALQCTSEMPSPSPPIPDTSKDEKIELLCGQLDKLQKELVASQSVSRQLESDLKTSKKIAQKVKKDYQRQLASVLKKSRQLGSQSSLNSSYSVRTNADTQSIAASEEVAPSLSGISLTSNGEATFLESDFRQLLDNLTSQQDENCTLKQRLMQLEDQLCAKETILQNVLSHSNHPSASITSPSSFFNAARRNPDPTRQGDFKVLKDLCHDLMIKNIALERAVNQKSTS